MGEKNRRMWTSSSSSSSVGVLLPLVALVLVGDVRAADPTGTESWTSAELSAYLNSVSNAAINKTVQSEVAATGETCRTTCTKACAEEHAQQKKHPICDLPYNATSYDKDPKQHSDGQIKDNGSADNVGLKYTLQGCQTQIGH